MLVYNEWDYQCWFGLLGLVCIFITYKLRKIFPFNIIWWTLAIIFVYALLHFAADSVKKSLKNWWVK